MRRAAVMSTVAQAYGRQCRGACHKRRTEVS
jgi:hypothetical protein